MIDLYSWATPNGHKIHIVLEELGLAYNTHAINIGAGDQFKPDFLAISPNNKIPAIVDQDGPGGQPLALFESGAILWYLAEKHGRLLPEAPVPRLETMQWLMFQMGGLGPMLGQAHHFRIYAPETIDYAVNRYTREANRLYGVLDQRLATRDYLVDAYSIADIACYPWTASHHRQGVDMQDYPHVRRWQEAIAARPAVRKGMAVLTRQREDNALTADKAQSALFGDDQYKRR